MKLPEVKETVEEHGMFVGETVYGRRCPANVQVWTYFFRFFVQGLENNMKLPDT